MYKSIRTILIFMLIGAGVYIFTYLISGLIAGYSKFLWLLEIDYKEPAEFIIALVTTEFPYIVLGILWALFLRDNKAKDYKEKKVCIISALIGVISINVLLYMSYYLDLLIGSASSTGSLIFFIFPFLATFFGAIGYAIGNILYLKEMKK